MLRTLHGSGRRRWAALAAALAAALGLTLGLTSTASATGHTTRADDRVKPTIVLVHGG